MEFSEENRISKFLSFYLYLNKREKTEITS